MQHKRQWIIAIMIMLLGLMLCGCTGGNTETRTLTKEPGAVCIKYKISPSYGDWSKPMYSTVITLATDGTLSYGFTCQYDHVPYMCASRTLSSAEFDEIYSHFSQSAVFTGSGDYSTDTCDGSYYTFEFYLDNGETFTSGGLQPSNKLFNDEADYFGGFVTEVMKEEARQCQDEFQQYADANPFSFAFYEEIAGVGYDFTEEQLASVGEDNLYSFLCNCENAVCHRNYFYGASLSEDGNTVKDSENIYRFELRDNDFDVYVHDELIANITMKTYVEVYTDSMNTIGVQFTEEELTSVDAELLIADLYDVIVNGDYQAPKAVFDKATCTFTGKDYSFIKKDENWDIYVAGNLSQSVPFKTLSEIHAEDLAKYKMSFTEDELQQMQISILLSYIKEFEKNPNYYAFRYDEATKTYMSETLMLSFENVKKSTYKIKIEDKEIGEVIVQK